MQKFSTTLSVVADESTKAIKALKDAAVYVYRGGTNNLATLYADNETDTKTNPLTTDDYGFVECRLPNGTYDIVTVNGNVVKKITGYYAFDGNQSPVTITMPSQYAVTGGVNVDWVAQAPNLVLATPVKAPNAKPAFRALVPLDVDTLTRALLRAKAPPGIGNNSSDAFNSIDIAQGACLTDGGTPIRLTTTLTKKLNATWAAGSTQGGLDTGTKASNAWYYLHLIYNPTSGSVDGLFSASATAPTLPSGFTEFRRLGAVRTDSSANLRPFTQTGDLFEFRTAAFDFNTGTLGNARQLVTLTTPPGMLARVRAAGYRNGSYAIVIQPTRETDAVPSGTAAPCLSLGGNSSTQGADLDVFADANSQIAVRSNSADTEFRIATRGWYDRRGRDD